MNKVSVYDYTDYREYLKDYFNDQKQKNRKYSYRVFAFLSGYNSSGLLKDVTTGRSNIQNLVIFKFARGLGLKKREASYFDNLVHFNQAYSIEEKNHYFENMIQSLKTDLQKQHKGEYKFCSKWYYAAIRDILSIIKFKNNYKELSRLLSPTITALEAKTAIKTMIRYQLIKRDKDGYYRSQDRITDGKVHLFNKINYQNAMLELTAKEMYHYSEKECVSSTLNFRASEEAFEKIKTEISNSNARIKEIIENCKDGNRLYQISNQLFPLSSVLTIDKKKNSKKKI